MEQPRLILEPISETGIVGSNLTHCTMTFTPQVDFQASALHRKPLPQPLVLVDASPPSSRLLWLLLVPPVGSAAANLGVCLALDIAGEFSSHCSRLFGSLMVWGSVSQEQDGCGLCAW